MLIIFSEV